MSYHLTSTLRDSSRYQIFPGQAEHIHDTATFSITRTPPQSATIASAYTPAVSLNGAAAAATNEPAQFPFAILTPSRLSTFPERLGAQKSVGDGAITLSSAWLNYPKHKRTTPIEQTEGYTHTRSVRLFLSTISTDINAL